MTTIVSSNGYARSAALASVPRGREAPVESRPALSDGRYRSICATAARTFHVCLLVIDCLGVPNVLQSAASRRCSLVPRQLVRVVKFVDAANLRASARESSGADYTG